MDVRLNGTSLGAGSWRCHRLLIGLLWLVGVACLLPLAAHATAQARERCFPETGYCVTGAILAYWERHGGLPIFGYPISAQRTETVEGSWTGPV
jgi:hypothetical protein